MHRWHASPPTQCSAATQCAVAQRQHLVTSGWCKPQEAGERWFQRVPPSRQRLRRRYAPYNSPPGFHRCCSCSFPYPCSTATVHLARRRTMARHGHTRRRPLTRSALSASKEDSTKDSAESPLLRVISGSVGYPSDHSLPHSFKSQHNSTLTGNHATPRHDRVLGGAGSRRSRACAASHVSRLPPGAVTAVIAASRRLRRRVGCGTSARRTGPPGK